MKKFRAITLLVLLVTMFAACTTPTPQVVIETQVVEKEVIKEVEVVKTVEVEKEVIKEVTVEVEVPVRADGLPEYTGGPAEIRIGWWGNDDRAARTLQVIQLFQDAYPEIKVTGEPNGGTADHFQIIDTQLAGNNAPDIFQLGGTGLTTRSTSNRSMTISANSS